MSLYKKFTFLLCVIILMSFTLTNGARTTYRRDKKCKRVQNFRRGSVFYQGERKVNSKAIYSCEPASSLFPSNVGFSVCGKNLKWEPAPPKCHKKAVLFVPSNGYISEGKKDFLHHLESYKVCCSRGYEVESDGQILSKSCIRIKNVDGSLVPNVQCIEERCDPGRYDRTDIKFKNGSLVTTKIPSRAVLVLSCKRGYGFYRYETPMPQQITRRCVQGRIVRAPRCQEAKCLFSGYPSSRYTYHREYLSDAMLIAEDQYIDAGKSVEVYCYRTDRFELFVNATQTYPKHFTTKCRKGSFDKKKEEFPVCVEKGCVFHISKESCFRTDDQGSCKPTDFKVSSGTSLHVGCKNGFRLYRSEVGLAVEVNETFSVDCSRGSHNSFEGYKCIPEYLLNVLESQGNRFPGELDRVSCRYLVLKSDICSDPCLIPKIPYGFVKQTQSNNRIEFETGHDANVTFICEEGFHFKRANSTLVQSFESSCNQGDWTNHISSTCEPDPCDLIVHDGTSFYHGSRLLLENKGQVHSLQNGTELEVVCRHGYEMEDVDRTGTVDDKRYSTCVNGKWTHHYNCVPEKCAVSEVKNALSLKKYVYDHTEKITIICDEGFHLYHNISIEMESECNLGNWTKEIPEECLPDPCDLKVHEGISFYHGSRMLLENNGQVHSLQNGTKLNVVCRHGYEMEGMNTTETVDSKRYSTCVKGIWTHHYNCVPEKCTVSEVTNALSLQKYVYDHTEKITIICDEGFHVYQNLSTEMRSLVSECNLGNWTNEIPEECLPDTCHLEVLTGASVFIGSNMLTENDVHVHSLPNGTEIEIVCKNGYRMENINNFGSDGHRGSSICVNGHLTHNYSCVPENCSSPKIMNAITPKKKDYKHSENISIICEDGFHFFWNLSKAVRSLENECNLGNWTNDFPEECNPDPCELEFREGTTFFHGSTLLPENHGQSHIFQNGTKIEVICNNGYKIDDINSTSTDNHQRYFTCVNGRWTHQYRCIPEACSAPVVMNTETLDKMVYNHSGSISLICKEGFHFIQNLSTVVRFIESECYLGRWKSEIPVECKPDECFLDTLAGTIYHKLGNNNNTMTGKELQGNGTTFVLMCQEGFDLYDKDEDIILDDMNNVTITCYHGDWDNEYTCRKRCVLPDDSNVVSVHNGTLVTNGDILLDGKSVDVKCLGETEDGYISLRCNNGYWQPKVNCSKDGINFPTPTVTMTTVESGCTLSPDLRYNYTDSEGKVTNPGATISDGTSLIVTCSIFTILLDYDYENENETIVEVNVTTVTCTGNKLSPFQLDCLEVLNTVAEDQCLGIEHGNVRKENGYYYVTCNAGFTLDVTFIEDPKFTCVNGKLAILHGKKEPSCKPKKCKVPDNKNNTISVTNGDGITLSRRSVVNNGEMVTFDCNSALNINLEPRGRKFICQNGLWKEKDDDQDWKLGNNGSFPICREAKCVPECENGGVCYKDNVCKCKKSAKGPRCENYSFDDSHRRKPENVTKTRLQKLDKKISLKESFDNGHRWNPKRSKTGKHEVNLGNDSKISLTACQQACVNMKDSLCVAIFYNKYIGQCKGYTVADNSYFYLMPVQWNSVVYLRKFQ